MWKRWKPHRPRMRVQQLSTACDKLSFDAPCNHGGRESVGGGRGKWRWRGIERNLCFSTTRRDRRHPCESGRTCSRAGMSILCSPSSSPRLGHVQHAQQERWRSPKLSSCVDRSNPPNLRARHSALSSELEHTSSTAALRRAALTTRSCYRPTRLLCAVRYSPRAYYALSAWAVRTGQCAADACRGRRGGR
eukprot:3159691-Rhodomonas_salina.1